MYWTPQAIAAMPWTLVLSLKMSCLTVALVGNVSFSGLRVGSRQALAEQPRCFMAGSMVSGPLIGPHTWPERASPRLGKPRPAYMSVNVFSQLAEALIR